MSSFYNGLMVCSNEGGESSAPPQCAPRGTNPHRYSTWPWLLPCWRQSQGTVSSRRSRHPCSSGCNCSLRSECLCWVEVGTRKFRTWSCRSRTGICAYCRAPRSAVAQDPYGLYGTKSCVMRTSVPFPYKSTIDLPKHLSESSRVSNCGAPPPSAATRTSIVPRLGRNDGHTYI